MKKITAFLLALLMAASLFAGCGQAAPVETTEPVSTAAETAPQEASPFPITVTDQIGNTVTVEGPAQRIVSGYYISSSACIALGLKDRLVATEMQIDERPIYAHAAPELVGTLPNVGSAKAFDLEACLSAEPDLVILPKKAKDYAATLAEMGIPAIVVSPESHVQLQEMISLIAALTGTQETAQALLDRYAQLLSQVAELTEGLSEEEKPVVYLGGTGSYLTTAPRDMYQAALINYTGGKNAGDVLEGDSWTDVSYEQLLAMNPDVIIIPTNSMANGQPDYTAADILADSSLSEVTAVKNGAIYNMPAGFEAWDSPVPSGVLGMLWMLSTLHPELYTSEEFMEEAADFYRSFYGFEIDTSAIQNEG